jgi:hypothetical protein
LRCSALARSDLHENHSNKSLNYETPKTTSH